MAAAAQVCENIQMLLEAAEFLERRERGKHPGNCRPPGAPASPPPQSRRVASLAGRPRPRCLPEVVRPLFHRLPQPKRGAQRRRLPSGPSRAQRLETEGGGGEERAASVSRCAVLRPRRRRRPPVRARAEGAPPSFSCSPHCGAGGARRHPRPRILTLCFSPLCSRRAARLVFCSALDPLSTPSKPLSGPWRDVSAPRCRVNGRPPCGFQPPASEGIPPPRAVILASERLYRPACVSSGT